MSVWDPGGFKAKNLSAPPAWHNLSSHTRSSNKELASWGQEGGHAQPLSTPSSLSTAVLSLALLVFLVAE